MDPSRTCRSCGGAQGDHLGAQVAFVFAILAWVLPLSFIMSFGFIAMDHGPPVAMDTLWMDMPRVPNKEAGLEEGPGKGNSPPTPGQGIPRVL